MALWYDMTEKDEDDEFMAFPAAGASAAPAAPWTGSVTTSTKVPPAFSGTMSWFTYQESVEDWLDITELDEEKRGPALRNRLEGAAEFYKQIFDRDQLKAANGAQYFLNTLQPYFVKGKDVVFFFGASFIS